MCYGNTAVVMDNIAAVLFIYYMDAVVIDYSVSVGKGKGIWWNLRHIILW